MDRVSVLEAPASKFLLPPTLSALLPTPCPLFKDFYSSVFPTNIVRQSDTLMSAKLCVWVLGAFCGLFACFLLCFGLLVWFFLFSPPASLRIHFKIRENYISTKSGNYQNPSAQAWSCTYITNWHNFGQKKKIQNILVKLIFLMLYKTEENYPGRKLRLLNSPHAGLVHHTHSSKKSLLAIVCIST